MSLVQPQSDATLAIDFAPDAVRVVEMQQHKGVPNIISFAQQTIDEGPSKDLPERHLAALNDLLKTQRVRTKRAIAAVPTSMVLTRTVQLDKSKGANSEEQILWALQNCLPFDSRDLVFDFWPVSDPNNGKFGEVMVVATQASLVEKYLRGFEQLGLGCVHLDVAPCAIATLLQHTSDNADVPIGTICLTATHGYFAIAERGRVLFWRPFELPSAGQGEGAMQTLLDRIGEEVSKCVSHMVGSMHLDNLAEMALFGQGAGDLLFSEYLKNRFHLPVTSPSPFDALPAEACPESLRQPADLKTATYYATALGLALQQSTGGIAHG